MPGEPAGRQSGSLGLRIVGGVAVALSALGLWYHATVSRSDFTGLDNPPYFFQAWSIMAGVSIVLLLGALVAGVQLLHLRTGWVPIFVVIEFLILLDSIVPGFLWLHPRWGMSIAAASGISSGGIFHLITLFPIWGSLVAFFAARRVRRAQLAVGV